MKQNIFERSRIILLVTMVGAFAACKKFIEIDPPKNTVTTTGVFSDSINATAGVTGIYSAIMEPYNSFLQTSITVNTGLASDELYPTSTSTDDAQFYTNGVSPLNNNPNAVFWQNAYIIIYRANACIEGLSKSSGISQSLKNQLTGEAKFIRALCFFHLVNLFGDVPLTLSTDFTVNAVMARTSKTDVYKQMVDDLVDAQKLMSTNYVSSGRARPNQYCAAGLLSRVYLYLGQWQNAESAASLVINNNTVYSLETTLNKVFLAGSKEAIWQLIPVLTGLETGEGYIFVPASANIVPTYVISNSLLNTFEANDQRKTNWLNSNTVATKTYYYPYKYRLGNDGLAVSKENYMLLRLAEIYLIRAEARAQLNNLSGAQGDLNIIRNRAGLANTTFSAQPALLNAIYHERQVELFCEIGHRWYDLKRTGNIDAVMSTVTPTKGGAWNTTANLFPIPFTQIQTNSFLIQNPGY